MVQFGLSLVFSGKDPAVLLWTEFKDEHRRRIAKRGKGAGTFTWSNGVKAMCLFFLELKASQVVSGTNSFVFQGWRGSAAATLDEAVLGSSPEWVVSMFGSRDPLLAYISRSNPNQKRPEEPFSLEVSANNIQKFELKVFRKIGKQRIEIDSPDALREISVALKGEFGVEDEPHKTKVISKGSMVRPKIEDLSPFASMDQFFSESETISPIVAPTSEDFRGNRLYQTAALSTAITKIEHQSILGLIGNQGCGKRTIALQLAIIFEKKGFTPFFLDCLATDVVEHERLLIHRLQTLRRREDTIFILLNCVESKFAKTAYSQIKEVAEAKAIFVCPARRGLGFLTPTETLRIFPSDELYRYLWRKTERAANLNFTEELCALGRESCGNDLVLFEMGFCSRPGNRTTVLLEVESQIVRHFQTLGKSEQRDLAYVAYLSRLNLLTPKSCLLEPDKLRVSPLVRQVFQNGHRCYECCHKTIAEVVSRITSTAFDLSEFAESLLVASPSTLYRASGRTPELRDELLPMKRKDAFLRALLAESPFHFTTGKFDVGLIKKYFDAFEGGVYMGHLQDLIQRLHEIARHNRAAKDIDGRLASGRNQEKFVQQIVSSDIPSVLALLEVSRLFPLFKNRLIRTLGNRDVQVFLLDCFYNGTPVFLAWFSRRLDQMQPLVSQSFRLAMNRRSSSRAFVEGIISSGFSDLFSLLQALDTISKDQFLFTLSAALEDRALAKKFKGVLSKANPGDLEQFKRDFLSEYPESSRLLRALRNF